jgi:PPE-repeat protein
MMDFGALPPEINSARMYLGPGPASMLAAGAGWESLAAELGAAASGYEAVISALTLEWEGPTSLSMAAAVAPYVMWMRATAEQCAQAAEQSTAAASAYETAHALTVPPPLIAANRAQLLALIATNFLGQNTPAIMATEAEYSEMWAQDATAMYDYAAASAAASTFTSFTAPPQTTNPAGNVQSTSSQLIASVPQTLQSLATPGTALGPSAASPLSALSNLTGTSTKTASKSASTGAGALSSFAAALPAAIGGSPASFLDAIGFGSDFAGLGADGAGLGADGAGLGIDGYGLTLDFEGAGSIIGAEGGALPGMGDLGAFGPVGGLGEGASASVGEAAGIGTLSVPPSWAETVSAVTPLPTMDANVMPGGWGAAVSPTSPSGAGISKLPLGAMVGRDSDGAVQRIGFRSSLIPRSPVAG